MTRNWVWVRRIVITFATLACFGNLGMAFYSAINHYPLGVMANIISAMVVGFGAMAAALTGRDQ